MRGNYGMQEGVVTIENQELGVQYIGTPKDTETLLKSAAKYGITPARAEEMRRRSREVKQAILEGDYEAVVLPGEEAPTGHGEFFHQMVASGRLLQYFREGVQWMTVRNIDNAAGTFDNGFLVALDYFLKNDLDFLGEVVPRAGQKGGAETIDPPPLCQKVFNEQPVFEATWKDWLESVKEEYTHVPINIKRPVDRRKALKIVYDMWIETKENVVLLDYPILGMEIRNELSELQRLLFEPGGSDEEGVLQIVQDKQGKYRLVHKVSSAEAYWFNPAVAIMRPKFLFYIYRKDDTQTVDDFVREMEHASPEELARIADRGRKKFPTLIDPKPAKQDAAAIKIETNLWQGTSIAAAAGARLDYIGTLSAQNVAPDEFARLADWEKDLMRFAACKQWEGRMESYRSNVSYVAYKLRKIVYGQSVELDVLDAITPDDPRALVQAMERIFILISAGVEPTTRDWTRLRSIVRTSFNNPYLYLLYDSKSHSLTAYDYRLVTRTDIANKELRASAQMYHFVPAFSHPDTGEMLYKQNEDDIRNLTGKPSVNQPFNTWTLLHYDWSPRVSKAVEENIASQQLLAAKDEAKAFRSPSSFLRNMYKIFANLGAPAPADNAQQMAGNYQHLADGHNAHPDKLVKATARH